MDLKVKLKINKATILLTKVGHVVELVECLISMHKALTAEKARP